MNPYEKNAMHCSREWQSVSGIGGYAIFRQARMDTPFAGRKPTANSSTWHLSWRTSAGSFHAGSPPTKVDHASNGRSHFVRFWPYESLWLFFYTSVIFSPRLHRSKLNSPPSPQGTFRWHDFASCLCTLGYRGSPICRCCPPARNIQHQ